MRDLLIKLLSFWLCEDKYYDVYNFGKLYKMSETVFLPTIS